MLHSVARNTWTNKIKGTKLQYQDNYNTTRRGPRTRGLISNRDRITICNGRYQITVQYQTYNQIAQDHNAILNWTVPEQHSAVILPSSAIYQQTHIHSEIQRNNRSAITRSTAENPTPHYNFKAKDTHKTTVLYLERTNRGTDPHLGSLPGTNAKQLNGSPDDERGRRSVDLFPTTRQLTPCSVVDPNTRWRS